MDAREQRRARAEERLRRSHARAAAGRDAPWRRRLRTLRRAGGSVLLRWTAPTLLRLLAWTWRVQRPGEPGRTQLERDEPWIAALWHGRLLVPLPLPRHRGRGIGVLVSPSDDGALVAGALRAFGYRVIRGSQSRGGARAMRELQDALLGGVPVVVTPDGPRGPRHTVNAGVAWLARATGAPIVPVAVAADRAWRLRSWDRFTIPKPWARLVVTYGDPIRVPPDSSDADVEAIGAQLAAVLLDAERAGFVALGVADDHGPAVR
jgi:lysophospholipid acyltransferase (LPLAT)-like uncharacterized protein